MYRHDPYTTPKEAKRLFGVDADHAALDHIILDWRHSPRRFKSQFKTYLERGCPADICARSSTTSVKPTTQPTGLDELCSVLKDFENLITELDGLCPQPNQTSNDRAGVFATLFRMFLLLTVFFNR